MTESTTDTHHWALLAQLEEFWQNPQPSRYGTGVPKRIAFSEHDQLVPEGTENPYWEIIRHAPLDTLSQPWRKFRPEPDGFFMRQDPDGYLISRSQLCPLYSWAIPSPGDIAWITGRAQGCGIVEPGAGGGYWAWQISQAGFDVVAFDPNPPESNKFVTGNGWFPVQAGDETVTAEHGDRSLLLCWPSYDEPWATEALRAYEGGQLFYAGEGPGGCCADDEFFHLLDAEWEEVGDCPAHVSFSMIHCYLTEYRRKDAQP